MKKIFNTAGTCFPEKHYMVDLKDRLSQISHMVELGKYFCINRARQYGKSTILYSLANILSEKYIVFSLSFQRMSTAKFRDEDTFCRAFIDRLRRAAAVQKMQGLDTACMERMEVRAKEYGRSLDLTDMFDDISDLCTGSSKPIVLIIDEVDNACNNQIFLDFLGQLRDLYLSREITPTFQSVILAGVYDIKNLKMKISPDTEYRYNSPWNIADDFTIDMSFRADEIERMLKIYEKDHHTGMDTKTLSCLIYAYTDGYPYMVSRICKLLDERISGTSTWTEEGFLEAVRLFVKEPNTLFDDMVKKLEEYPELKNRLNDILFRGIRYSYETDHPIINIGKMFGFMKDDQGSVAVANRIFEMKLYNLLLSETEDRDKMDIVSTDIKNQFVIHGMLQMDLVMQNFYEYFEEICKNSSDKFIEDEGRRIFLMFLRPIINGTGNYYVEAQTRDRTRTDVIIDFRGRRSVVELKLWHGKAYEQRGREQLFEYLEYYHLQKGYLLSFNFNKNKKTGIYEIRHKDKWIMEVIV